MSGFVGVLGLNGVAVEQKLVRRLAAAAEYRGSDRTSIWMSPRLGLGHTLMATRPYQADEAQPALLGNNMVIVGDIRLDARAELISSLASHGEDFDKVRVQDAELALRAFRVWGEASFSKLMGDFSFALWDATADSLHLVRDLFGTKPLYYGVHDGQLIFTNTFPVLRLFPPLLSEINPRAIGDFFSCGYNRSLNETGYQAIRRVLPGHVLSVRGVARSEQIIRGFPDPVANTTLSDQSIQEGFIEVIGRAVADRIPEIPATLLLSGGLDSGVISASIKRGAPVTAICASWARFFEDPEPGFAKITAAHAGIPLDIFEQTSVEFYGTLGSVTHVTPEPCLSLFSVAGKGVFEKALQHGRVILDGQGADELFRGPDLIDDLMQGRISEALYGIDRTWRRLRRRPPINLRAHFRRAWTKQSALDQWPDPPSWVKREKIDAGTDGRSLRSEDSPAPSNRVIATSTRMQNAIYAKYFESLDAGLLRVPVDIRWPFFDLRVIHFVLSFPAYPWRLQKHLSRSAFSARLPHEITSRRKQPLQGSPPSLFNAAHPEMPETLLQFREQLNQWMNFDQWAARWRSSIPESHGEASSLQRPIAYAHWLKK